MRFARSSWCVVLVTLGIGCGSAEPATTPLDEADSAAVAPDDVGAIDRDEGVASDSEPTTEAGPALDAATDAPTKPPGKVPIFVAHGHAGRTTISCDDGRTWIEDRSDDPGLTCFVDGNDCDHHPGAARGIAYGDGWFVATYGWGKPGSIRRSKDGVTWEKVVEGTTFGGMVHAGKGAFLAASRSPRASLDHAKTWAKTAEPKVDLWNVRGAGLAGDRVLMIFEDSGEKDFALSADAGATWTKPSSLPASCGSGVQGGGGVLHGKGVTVVVGTDGTACRSSDGGVTWSEAKMGGTVSSSAVFTGTEFVAWGRAGSKPVAFRSADGASWSTTPTSVRTKKADGTTSTAPGPEVGAAARGDEGTFVAVKGGWQQWYAKQVFYRSEDGVTWDALEAGAFTGSHPIRAIVFGWGEPSGSCK